MRQYFPKGKSLAGVSQAELDEVARKLNDRPRQTLGFRTPAEKLTELIDGPHTSRVRALISLRPTAFARQRPDGMTRSARQGWCTDQLRPRTKAGRDPRAGRAPAARQERNPRIGALTNANLTSVDLTSADLTSANLSGADLHGTIFCYTTMPDGSINNRDCGPRGAKPPASKSRTFVLAAATTRTFDVGYPSALKYRRAKHFCDARVSGPGKRYVKILSHHSARGGTVCRVSARDNAKLPSLDTTAKIKVTATTIGCIECVAHQAEVDGDVVEGLEIETIHVAQNARELRSKILEQAEALQRACTDERSSPNPDWAAVEAKALAMTVSATTMAKDPGYAVIVATIEELRSRLPSDAEIYALGAIMSLKEAERYNHGFAEPLMKAGELLVLHPDQRDDCADLSQARRASAELDGHAQETELVATRAMRQLANAVKPRRRTGTPTFTR